MKIEDIVKYFKDINNSANSTNAEEKAIRSLYHLIAIPAIVAMVSSPSFFHILAHWLRQQQELEVGST